MRRDVKRRTYQILEQSAADDVPSRVFDIFIMSLISLNVLAVILETVNSLVAQYMRFFQIFEIFSVLIFTVEYITRLWSCTADARFQSPIKGRLRFVLTPLALVDLVALLPFYVPTLVVLDLRFVRALRLFRLFRVFKLGRYSESIRTLGNVLADKKAELLTTLYAALILLLVASSLMYFVENEAQPQAFSSIPDAMWWGVATLTTVGYGDVYPITPLGRFIGTIIALLGIGMFALPAGILGSGFVEEIQKKKGGEKFCPHCGEVVDELLETPPHTN